MSEEKQKQLKLLIKDLVQLDMQSLSQMQFIATILLARDRQVKCSSEKSSILT